MVDQKHELAKVMRFSWELNGTAPQVDKTLDWSDLDVLNILKGRLPDTGFFIDPKSLGASKSPKISYGQLISVPTILAFMYSKNQIISTLRNRWRSALSLDVRREVLDSFGITRDHRFVHIILGDTVEVDKFVSYLAASFGFTTYVVPLIKEFSEVAEMSMRDENDQAFYQDYADLENSPLLIIKNALSYEYKLKVPLHTGVKLLRDRVANGRVTVFVDSIIESGIGQSRLGRNMGESRSIDSVAGEAKAGDTLLAKYNRGALTTTEQWRLLISSSKAAQGGVAGFLQSGYIYRCLNWIPETLNGGSC